MMRTLVGPSEWANYLVKGYDKELKDSDKKLADLWMAQVGSKPICASPTGTKGRHDAANIIPCISYCHNYTFEIK